MVLYPAIGVKAALRGLRGAGLDPVVLKRAAGIEDLDLDAPDATVSQAVLVSIWTEALRRAPREELPTEAGLAVPLGALGIVDYLAGSATTVEAAICTARDNIRALSPGIILELVPDRTGAWLNLVTTNTDLEPALASICQEYTLAVLLGRLRAVAQGAFRADAVALTRRPPARMTRHHELLGAPVTFDRTTTAAHLTLASLQSSMRTTDQALSRTMTDMVRRLAIGAEAPIELAVRRSLATGIKTGKTDAATIAQSLGMSERTLHRRLVECGTSYLRLHDAFRSAHAERLLLESDATAARVGQALGFGDQTAFIRAFRRWKGCTPREWRAKRRAELEGQPSAGWQKKPTG